MATTVDRSELMAQLQNQILVANLIQTGATINKSGEIEGSPTQIQAELNKRDKLRQLEDKERALLAPGLAPPPPELDDADPKDTPDSLTRTANRGLRQVALGLRGAAFGIKGFARRTNQRLARIPTPGDVYVPITILLILFLVLLPVNGHTRLNWLWRVYMGDAQIALTPQTPTIPPAPTPTAPPIPPAQPGSGGNQFNTTLPQNGASDVFSLQDFLAGTNYLTLIGGILE